MASQLPKWVTESNNIDEKKKKYGKGVAKGATGLTLEDEVILDSYLENINPPPPAVNNMKKINIQFQKNLRCEIVSLVLIVEVSDDFKIIKDLIIKHIHSFYKNTGNISLNSKIDLNIYSLYEINTDNIISSFAALVDNSYYTYRLPEKIFACSGSEWDNTKLTLLRILINKVETVYELLELDPSDIVITPRANSLKFLLKNLNHNNANNIDYSICSNKDSLEEYQAQLIWKLVFAMHKYSTNESIVDKFLSTLLTALGFDEKMMLVLPQFPMDLRFGTTVKEAIADFAIVHLRSYLRIAIVEDKNVRNEFANSEPQLMAEIIAAYQTNNIKSNVSSKSDIIFDEESEEKDLKKQKSNFINDFDDISPPPFYLGIRVNGSRFYFYAAPIGESIENAMYIQSEATKDTEVRKLGGNNGLNFLIESERNEIIDTLDCICKWILDEGERSARRESFGKNKN